MLGSTLSGPLAQKTQRDALEEKVEEYKDLLDTRAPGATGPGDGGGGTGPETVDYPDARLESFFNASHNLSSGIDSLARTLQSFEYKLAGVNETFARTEWNLHAVERDPEIPRRKVQLPDGSNRSLAREDLRLSEAGSKLAVSYEETLDRVSAIRLQLREDLDDFRERSRDLRALYEERGDDEAIQEHDAFVNRTVDRVNTTLEALDRYATTVSGINGTVQTLDAGSAPPRVTRTPLDRGGELQVSALTVPTRSWTNETFQFHARFYNTAFYNVTTNVVVSTPNGSFEEGFEATINPTEAPHSQEVSFNLTEPLGPGRHSLEFRVYEYNDTVDRFVSAAEPVTVTVHRAQPLSNAEVVGEFGSALSASETARKEAADLAYGDSPARHEDYGTLPHGIRNFGNGQDAVPPDQTYPTDPSAVPDRPLNRSARVRDLASQLGGDPARIYSYVRDAVDLEAYHGSMKGARGALMYEAGNPLDQAALSVALLRESDYDARIVRGTVTAENDSVARLYGVAEDGVGRLFRSAGIPHEPAEDGLRFEHAWVEYKEAGSWRVFDPSWSVQPRTERPSTTVSLPPGSNETTLQFALRKPSAAGAPDNVSIENLTGNFSDDDGGEAPPPDGPDPIGEEFTKASIPVETPFDTEGVLSKTRGLPSHLVHEVTVEVQNLTYSTTAIDAVLRPPAILFEWEETRFGGPATTPGYLLEARPILVAGSEVVARGSPVSAASDLEARVEVDAPTVGSRNRTDNVPAGRDTVLGVETGWSTGKLVDAEAARGQALLEATDGSAANLTNATREAAALGGLANRASFGYAAARLGLQADKHLARYDRAAASLMWSGQNLETTRLGDAVQIRPRGTFVDIFHHRLTVSRAPEQPYDTVRIPLLTRTYQTLNQSATSVLSMMGGSLDPGLGQLIRLQSSGGMPLLLGEANREAIRPGRLPEPVRANVEAVLTPSRSISLRSDLGGENGTPVAWWTVTDHRNGTMGTFRWKTSVLDNPDGAPSSSFEVAAKLVKDFVVGVIENLADIPDKPREATGFKGKKAWLNPATYGKIIRDMSRLIRWTGSLFLEDPPEFADEIADETGEHLNPLAIRLIRNIIDLFNPLVDDDLKALFNDALVSANQAGEGIEEAIQRFGEIIKQFNVNLGEFKFAGADIDLKLADFIGPIVFLYKWIGHLKEDATEFGTKWDYLGTPPSETWFKDLLMFWGLWGKEFLCGLGGKYAESLVEEASQVATIVAPALGEFLICSQVEEMIINQQMSWSGPQVKPEWTTVERTSDCKVRFNDFVPRNKGEHTAEDMEIRVRARGASVVSVGGEHMETQRGNVLDWPIDTSESTARSDDLDPWGDQTRDLEVKLGNTPATGDQSKVLVSFQVKYSHDFLGNVKDKKTRNIGERVKPPKSADLVPTAEVTSRSGTDTTTVLLLTSVENKEGCPIDAISGVNIMGGSPDAIDYPDDPTPLGEFGRDWDPGPRTIDPNDQGSDVPSALTPQTPTGSKDAEFLRGWVAVGQDICSDAEKCDNQAVRSSVIYRLDTGSDPADEEEEEEDPCSAPPPSDSDGDDGGEDDDEEKNELAKAIEDYLENVPEDARRSGFDKQKVSHWSTGWYGVGEVPDDIASNARDVQGIIKPDLQEWVAENVTRADGAAFDLTDSGSDDDQPTASEQEEEDDCDKPEPQPPDDHTDPEPLKSAESVSLEPFRARNTDVLILDAGFASPIASQLAAHNITYRRVERAELVEMSNATLDPYRTLIVPADGLYIDGRSEEVGQAIDTFVRRGGRLVTFAQQTNDHWQSVPGDLEAHGYETSTACYSTSSEVTDAYHPVLASQMGTVLDVNLDGTFKDLPAGADVLLTRTAASGSETFGDGDLGGASDTIREGLPVAATYGHGEGRVLVSSLFPGAADLLGLDSPDTELVLRDMVRWGRARGAIGAAPLDGSIDETVPVTNYDDEPVTIQDGSDGDPVGFLHVVDPDQRTARAFELADYLGDGTTLAPGETVEVDLSTSVAEDFPTGIWKVQYSFHGWDRFTTDWVSVTEFSGPTLTGFNATPSPLEPGDRASLNATLFNPPPHDFEGAVNATLVNPQGRSIATAQRNLTIPGGATGNLTVPVDAPGEMLSGEYTWRIRALDNGTVHVDANRTAPVEGIELDLDPAADAPQHQVRDRGAITLTARNTGDVNLSARNVTMRLEDHEGSLVTEVNRTLALDAGGDADLNFPFRVDPLDVDEEEEHRSGFWHTGVLNVTVGRTHLVREASFEVPAMGATVRNATFNQSTYRPGEDGHLTVDVEATGGVDLQEVRLDAGFQGVRTHEDTIVDVPSIWAGNRTTVTVPFTVEETAGTGPMTADLTFLGDRVEYNEFGDIVGTENYPIGSGTATAQVEGKEGAVDVTFEQETAVAGEAFSGDLVVTNDGTVSYDGHVTATFTLPGGDIPVQRVTPVDGLAPGETRRIPFNFTVEAPFSGQGHVDLRLDVRGSTLARDRFPFDVDADSILATSVPVDAEYLEGETVSTEVRLENTRDTPQENLTLVARSNYTTVTETLTLDAGEVRTVPVEYTIPLGTAAQSQALAVEVRDDQGRLMADLSRSYRVRPISDYQMTFQAEGTPDVADGDATEHTTTWNLTQTGTRHFNGTLVIEVWDPGAKDLLERTERHARVDPGSTTGGNFTYEIPPELPPGTYEVRMSVQKFGDVVTRNGTPLAETNSFLLPGTSGRIRADVQDPYLAGTNATLDVTVANTGSTRMRDVHLEVRIPGVFSSLQSVTVPAGTERTFPVDLDLPNNTLTREYPLVMEATLPDSRLVGDKDVAENRTFVQLRGLEGNVSVVDQDQEAYLLPDDPDETTPVHLDIQVNNSGPVDYENVSLEVFHGRGDVQTFDVGGLESGDSTLVFFDVELPGSTSSGQARFPYQLVTDDGTYVELGNIHVPVYHRDDLVSVRTNRDTYNPGDAVHLEASIKTPNASEPFDGTLRFDLPGIHNTTKSVQIPEGHTERVDVNVDFRLPEEMVSDGYKMRLELVNGTGETVAERTPLLRVRGLNVHASQMTTDQEAYLAGETASTSLVVENRGPSYLDGFVDLQLVDPDDGTVLVNASREALAKPYGGLTKIDGALDIPADVEAGRYLFRAVTTTRLSDLHVAQDQVPIHVATGELDFGVRDLNTTLYPGSQQTLEIPVRNPGPAPVPVEVSTRNASDWLTSSSRFEVGPRESHVYRLGLRMPEDASLEPREIAVNFSRVGLTDTVTVNASGLDLSIVEDGTEIIPSQVNEFNVTVRNDDTQPVTGLGLAPSFPGTVTPENTTLDPGSTATFTVRYEPPGGLPPSTYQESIALVRDGGRNASLPYNLTVPDIVIPRGPDTVELTALAPLASRHPVGVENLGSVSGHITPDGSVDASGVQLGFAPSKPLLHPIRIEDVAPTVTPDGTDTMPVGNHTGSITWADTGNTADLHVEVLDVDVAPTNVTYDSFRPGEERSFNLTLTNNEGYPINPQFRGSEWMSFSNPALIVDPGESRTVEVRIAVPDATRADVYEQAVRIRHSDGNVSRVPVDIHVPQVRRLELDQASWNRTTHEGLYDVFHTKVRNTGNQFLHMRADYQDAAENNTRIWYEGSCLESGGLIGGWLDEGDTVPVRPACAYDLRVYTRYPAGLGADNLSGTVHLWPDEENRSSGAGATDLEVDHHVLDLSSGQEQVNWTLQEGTSGERTLEFTNNLGQDANVTVAPAHPDTGAHHPDKLCLRCRVDRTLDPVETNTTTISSGTKATVSVPYGVPNQKLDLDTWGMLAVTAENTTSYLPTKTFVPPRTQVQAQDNITLFAPPGETRDHRIPLYNDGNVKAYVNTLVVANDEPGSLEIPSGSVEVPLDETAYQPITVSPPDDAPSEYEARLSFEALSGGVETNATVLTGKYGLGTVTVDDDGTTNYTTIQGGVDALPNGGVVQVKPGTYEESVELDKPLILEGLEGPDETFVEYDGYYDPVLDVRSGSVEVRNLTLKHTEGEHVELADHANYFRLSDANLSSTDEYASGTNIRLGTGTQGHRITNVTHWSIGDGSRAIYADEVADVRVEDLRTKQVSGLADLQEPYNFTFEDVHATGLERGIDAAGSYYGSGWGVTVRNSQLVWGGPDNYYEGIIVDDLSSFNLTGNHIEGFRTGVEIQYSQDGTMEENSIVGSDVGFEISGDKMEELLHDIDRTNTIDGDPIIYLADEQDVNIRYKDAGYIAVYDSRRVHLEGIDLVGSEEIQIYDSEHVRLEDIDHPEGPLHIDVQDVDDPTPAEPSSNVTLSDISAPTLEIDIENTPDARVEDSLVDGTSTYSAPLFVQRSPRFVLADSTLRSDGDETELRRIPDGVVNRTRFEGGDGLLLRGSDRVKVLNSTFADANEGLLISSSENVFLDGNRFRNITEPVGFETSRWDPEPRSTPARPTSYNHTVTRNNLVDGRPILYLNDDGGTDLVPKRVANETFAMAYVVDSDHVALDNVTVRGPASRVWLSGSQEVDLQALEAPDPLTGYSSQVPLGTNQATNVTVTDADIRGGIWIHESDDVTVAGSAVERVDPDPYWAGIETEYSDRFVLEGTSVVTEGEDAVDVGTYDRWYGTDTDDPRIRNLTLRDRAASQDRRTRGLDLAARRGEVDELDVDGFGIGLSVNGKDNQVTDADVQVPVRPDEEYGSAHYGAQIYGIRTTVEGARFHGASSTLDVQGGPTLIRNVSVDGPARPLELDGLGDTGGHNLTLEGATWNGHPMVYLRNVDGPTIERFQQPLGFLGVWRSDNVTVEDPQVVAPGAVHVAETDNVTVSGLQPDVSPPQDPWKAEHLPPRLLTLRFQENTLARLEDVSGWRTEVDVQDDTLWTGRNLDLASPHPPVVTLAGQDDQLRDSTVRSNHSIHDAAVRVPDDSRGTELRNNTITSAYRALLVDDSDTLLVGNRLHGDEKALHLERGGVEGRDNALTGPDHPLSFDLGYYSDLLRLDTSNTVNGAPLRLLQGVSDAEYLGDTGYLYLTDATNVTFRDAGLQGGRILDSSDVDVKVVSSEASSAGQLDVRRADDVRLLGQDDGPHPFQVTGGDDYQDSGWDLEVAGLDLACDDAHGTAITYKGDLAVRNTTTEGCQAGISDPHWEDFRPDYGDLIVANTTLSGAQAALDHQVRGFDLRNSTFEGQARLRPEASGVSAAAGNRFLGGAPAGLEVEPDRDGFELAFENNTVRDAAAGLRVIEESYYGYSASDDSVRVRNNTFQDVRCGINVGDSCDLRTDDGSALDASGNDVNGGKLVVAPQAQKLTLSGELGEIYAPNLEQLTLEDARLPRARGALLEGGATLDSLVMDNVTRPAGSDPVTFQIDAYDGSETLEVANSTLHAVRFRVQDVDDTASIQVENSTFVGPDAAPAPEGDTSKALLYLDGTGDFRGTVANSTFREVPRVIKTSDWTSDQAKPTVENNTARDVGWFVVPNLEPLPPLSNNTLGGDAVRVVTEDDATLGEASGEVHVRGADAVSVEAPATNVHVLDSSTTAGSVTDDAAGTHVAAETERLLVENSDEVTVDGPVDALVARNSGLTLEDTTVAGDRLELDQVGGTVHNVTLAEPGLEPLLEGASDIDDGLAVTDLSAPEIEGLDLAGAVTLQDSQVGYTDTGAEVLFGGDCRVEDTTFTALEPGARSAAVEGRCTLEGNTFEGGLGWSVSQGIQSNWWQNTFRNLTGVPVDFDLYDADDCTGEPDYNDCAVPDVAANNTFDGSAFLQVVGDEPAPQTDAHAGALWVLGATERTLDPDWATDVREIQVRGGHNVTVHGPSASPNLARAVVAESDDSRLEGGTFGGPVSIEASSRVRLANATVDVDEAPSAVDVATSYNATVDGADVRGPADGVAINLTRTDRYDDFSSATTVRDTTVQDARYGVRIGWTPGGYSTDPGDRSSRNRFDGLAMVDVDRGFEPAAWTSDAEFDHLARQTFADVTYESAPTEVLLPGGSANLTGTLGEVYAVDAVDTSVRNATLNGDLVARYDREDGPLLVADARIHGDVDVDVSYQDVTLKGIESTGGDLTYDAYDGGLLQDIQLQSPASVSLDDVGHVDNVTLDGRPVVHSYDEKDVWLGDAARLVADLTRVVEVRGVHDAPGGIEARYADTVIVEDVTVDEPQAGVDVDDAEVAAVRDVEVQGASEAGINVEAEKVDLTGFDVRGSDGLGVAVDRHHGYQRTDRSAPPYLEVRDGSVEDVEAPGLRVEGTTIPSDRIRAVDVRNVTGDGPALHLDGFDGTAADLHVANATAAHLAGGARHLVASSFTTGPATRPDTPVVRLDAVPDGRLAELAHSRVENRRDDIKVTGLEMPQYVDRNGPSQAVQVHHNEIVNATNATLELDPSNLDHASAHLHDNALEADGDADTVRADVSQGDAESLRLYRNNVLGNGTDAELGGSYWSNHEGATGAAYQLGDWGNYWSNYTGPDADGDGIGDEPHPLAPGWAADLRPRTDPYPLDLHTPAPEDGSSGPATALVAPDVEDLRLEADKKPGPDAPTPPLLPAGTLQEVASEAPVDGTTSTAPEAGVPDDGSSTPATEDALPDGEAGTSNGAEPADDATPTGDGGAAPADGADEPTDTTTSEPVADAENATGTEVPGADAEVEGTVDTTTREYSTSTADRRTAPGGLVSGLVAAAATAADALRAVVHAALSLVLPTASAAGAQDARDWTEDSFDDETGAGYEPAALSTWAARAADGDAGGSSMEGAFAGPGGAEAVYLAAVAGASEADTRDRLQDLENTTTGGYGAGVADTAFALLALHEVGASASDPAVADGLAYLEAAQGPAGGYGLAASDDPAYALESAAAARALHAYGRTAQAGEAAGWLEAHEDAPGVWASPRASLHAAWTLRAMGRFDANRTEALENFEGGNGYEMGLRALALDTSGARDEAREHLVDDRAGVRNADPAFATWQAGIHLEEFGNDTALETARSVVENRTLQGSLSERVAWARATSQCPPSGCPDIADGVGPRPGWPADPASTGRALEALVQADLVDDANASAAADWLVARQAADGSIGSPEETAWAALGLMAEGDHSGAVDAAAAYLVTQQQTNGSIGDDVEATAPFLILLAQRDDPTERTALDDAHDWMIDVQRADGAWSGPEGGPSGPVTQLAFDAVLTSCPDQVQELGEPTCPLVETTDTDDVT